jgi:hypothetical protein
MRPLCSFLLGLALWACGGRTAYDASLNGAAAGGSSGADGTGGSGGFSSEECPAVRFQVVSTPGYDTQWCVSPDWGNHEVFDIANDSGSLSMTPKGARCGQDCSHPQPEPPNFPQAEYVIENNEVTWTGLYHTFSTCAESTSACSTPHCASPGEYLVTVCGYVDPNPQWAGGCQEANDQTPVFCGAAEFQYPAAAPVQVTLRPAD